MKDILSFYERALENIREARTQDHLSVMDRAMMQAQAAIATAQAQQANAELIQIVKALIIPGAPTAMPRTNTEADLVNALFAAQQGLSGEDEAKGPTIHPSAFADLDLGDDEPVLSENEKAADDQLKARLRADIEAAHAERLKK